MTLTPIYPGPSLTGRTFPNPGWHLPTNIGITPPDISAFPITGVATLLWDAPPERLTDTSRTCFESQTQAMEWRTARVAKICQADKTWVTARPHTWLQSSPSLTQLRKFPSQDSVIQHLIWPPSVWDLLLYWTCINWDTFSFYSNSPRVNWKFPMCKKIEKFRSLANRTSFEFDETW